MNLKIYPCHIAIKRECGVGSIGSENDTGIIGKTQLSNRLKRRQVGNGACACQQIAVKDKNIVDGGCYAIGNPIGCDSKIAIDINILSNGRIDTRATDRHSLRRRRRTGMRDIAAG